jgi:hypothetical protein
MFTRNYFIEQGFMGFVSFRELRSGGISLVPRLPGVYVVLRMDAKGPTFLERSCGGWHKGRDPTVEAHVLEQKWIDGSQLVYVGKGANLRIRIRDYMHFGEGKPRSHHGGRYIWQLADSPDLVVGWRVCQGRCCHRTEENKLLRSFMKIYDGRLPFANIDGPTRDACKE